MRILLIGPLPIENDVIGGTKVSFRNLVAFLRDDTETEIEVINTSRPIAGRGRIAVLFANIGALLRTYAALIWRTPRSDIVMLNLSAHAALKTAWLMTFIVRTLFRRRFVVRVFGGDMFHASSAASFFARKLFSYTLRNAEISYLQTKTLVSAFPEFPNVRWLPTTRDMSPRDSSLPTECRRALFLSQVKKSKGVVDILEASKRVHSTYAFTVAGPMIDCDEFVDDPSYPDVKISGPVPFESVAGVIESHDVLLLPSHRVAEGYPGILLEAMQLGVPIIATKLDSLQEIVKDGVNGLLVPVGNPEALADALDRLADDPTFFQQLQAGALSAGEEFRIATRMNILKSAFRQILTVGS